MVTDKDFGWSKVMRELYRLSKKEVTVGIQSGTMTEDGETTLARIAAVHEFGGTITQQADTVTINRKLKRDGSFANGGRFVKRKKANFSSTHARRARTIKIPQRSFLRATVDEKQAQITKLATNAVKSVIEGTDPEAAMRVVGQSIEGMVQKKITSGPFTPNAPSTIKRKRSSRTLIDTGHMRQSVRYNLISKE